MEKFEYNTYVYDTKGWMGGLIESQDFREALNNFGRDGWELVSSVSTTQGNGYTRSILCIFKRKIQ